ncbi:site-specific integrase [Pseudomonas alkylphenolica]|uniref:site-specific integrase n=1 Tax=Pseudomonas alkylphenolica TaxID=237609 RepID=UPI001F4F51E8|nr:site-specific integrase [Pseudomonas alkylphenolica]
MPALVNKTPRKVPVKKYRYVTLPLVSLFRKSSHSNDEDGSELEASLAGNYFIRPFDSDAGDKVVRNVPVILNPDGSIWKHGALYILARAIDFDAPSDQTLKGFAKSLVDYMNTLAQDGVDYLATPKREGSRPTFHYKAELKLKVNLNEIAASTANGRISAVVNFYRWMQGRHDYHPTEALWTEKVCRIPYHDKRGFYRNKKVITTNLRIVATGEDSTGDYIIDEGKLYPYSQEQQISLVQTLVASGNTEMFLAFLLSIFTGSRISTTFTIRQSNIVNPELVKTNEIAVKIGRGTLIDNKFNKTMLLYIPAWLNALLYVYINSDRHKRRATKASARNGGEQYVFLTQHGNPYYISKNDMERGQDKPIQEGYSVRQFASKKFQALLNQSDTPFKFRFHNLRACFCMNLIDQKLKGIPNSDTNRIYAVLTEVQRRMGHSDISTTQRYSRFRETRNIGLQAQSDFELHLQTLAENYVYA